VARAWDPDVVIDSAFALRRISTQFPEYSGASIEPIGEGFDNAAFLVDGRTVFRLPRRALAVRFLENEARILPYLAPHLPLPIPAPAYLGHPDEAYPYPFAGYPFVTGSTACSYPWSDEARGAAAPAIGRFLRALHEIPIFDGAPRDEIRRADLPYRLGQLQARAEAVPEARALLPHAESLAATPAGSRLTWVHGDLHPRHLLVDRDGLPAAVIDWGDVHVGDPALDLSIAFTFLPPSARPAFRAAYGAIDDDTWNRARFRALFYAAVLIEYGRDVRDKAMERTGLTIIRLATHDEAVSNDKSANQIRSR
jgi:aminoglycoside phosphotransferase (APT) family kinase protein